jgi:hypothetical protein
VTVRFLADEDVDPDIVQGLLTQEPAIDILDVKVAKLRMKDPAVLELAAQQWTASQADEWWNRIVFLSFL